MGKTGKVQTKPVSAFAVYSTGTTANNAKRERVESASSLQERPAEPTFYPIIDQDRSKPSSSLIKNISNKFSLGRAASKRKTKQKKPVKDKLSLNAEPQWNPVELNNSQIPMVNFSSEPVNFGLQSKNQLTKTKLLFKKDASIELSTSQSLSSCDDEPVQTEEKKIEKSESFAVTHTLGPDTHPPPRKRLRVVKAEDEMVVCDPGNDDQLHGSGENIKERTPKKAIKPSSSLSSSCTTISKKASSVPKMPFPDGDSEKDGKVLFDWLILPYTADKFFENIWEKKPFCLSRHIPNYADGLFSSKELNRILKECNVRYSVNLDVTTYQNGCRETHNIEGRAFAPVVWDYYKNGCSIRIKNPQAFSKPVWRLCATLQEHFKSMVGANVYLTPPGSQGFAPHYDDIEAFVLQLEGEKQWNIYNPRNAAETLPRFSSKNFDESEIGEPIFSKTLQAGDLLYFPRGIIHQAKSLPDTHSLHITISTYQMNTWGDFLEKLLPATLQTAIADDIEFRKGLPLQYLSCLGLQNSDKNPEMRQHFFRKISDLFLRLARMADVDAVADERAINFLHDALPPYMTPDEKSRTIQGCDVTMASPGNPVQHICDIDEKTRIRVLRKNAIRIVTAQSDANDNSVVQVYHCVQNSRIYHSEEKKSFEMDEDCAPALEHLINSYPSYVTVNSLPLRTDEDKVNLAISLFEKGILVTEKKVKMLQT